MNKIKVYPEQGRRVFIGLSGGVDSAVSAALLKQQGYDVTGVFIKVWQPNFLPCTWREERRDAMRVALALDIPFLFFDFEEEYKKGVADKMIEEYKKGRTPNPDVLCNREVKFGAFWQKAREMGADYIATGHYARVVPQNFSSEQSSDIPSEHGQIFRQKSSATLQTTNYKLQTGTDLNKDQSYFLWTLTQEDLAHTLFPIGHLEKKEVRKLAQKFKLPVAEKKDSQGICFVGEVSIEEFLKHFINIRPGNVLNVEGEVIGRHNGALLYTFGERRGFNVEKKKSNDGAYYVVAKDMKRNTITVSNLEKEINKMSPNKVILKDVNWTRLPTPEAVGRGGQVREPEGENLEARIRYRGEKLKVESLKWKAGEGGKGRGVSELMVVFPHPIRGLSLGQSIVFYDGDECLGGAVMDKVV